jgi:hypothetical protein
LTSSVFKVFEKIILVRLDCTANETHLFPDEQAGFRKGRSPIEQAYILREILDYRKGLKKQTGFSYGKNTYKRLAKSDYLELVQQRRLPLSPFQRD